MSSETNQTPAKASWVDRSSFAALIVFPLSYLCSLLALCFAPLDQLLMIAAFPAFALTLAFLYCCSRFPALDKACNAPVEFLYSLRFIGDCLKLVGGVVIFCMRLFID